jgi:hypothetical protein
VNIGDLVRSQSDVDKDIEGPLGILVDIDRKKSGEPIVYYVFLFKWGTIESFNVFYSKLVKFK